MGCHNSKSTSPADPSSPDGSNQKVPSIAHDNHARIMKMPIKPGSLAAVTKIVNDTFTEQLKTFDQLYALDMFAASEEQIVVVARYTSKAKLDEATPKVQKLVGSMKEHIAGKPEGYLGRIGWSMAAGGTAGDDTAMRMTELPVKPGTTAATVEGIMEGLSSSEDVKALKGLVGAESTLVDGTLITISKYENEAGIEASAAKMKILLAPMKDIVAGPPVPTTGKRIYSFAA